MSPLLHHYRSINSGMENEIIIIDENEETAEQTVVPSQAQEDFETSRESMQDLIAMGMKGLDVALNLVKESDSPRAIETFATLLKTVSDINMNMIHIHSKKNSVGTSSTELVPLQDNSNNVTQNLFVGSTNDLSRMLKEITEANIKNIN